MSILLSFTLFSSNTIYYTSHPLKRFMYKLFGNFVGRCIILHIYQRTLYRNDSSFQFSNCLQIDIYSMYRDSQHFSFLQITFVSQTILQTFYKLSDCRLFVSLHVHSRRRLSYHFLHDINLWYSLSQPSYSFIFHRRQCSMDNPD